MLRLYQLMPVTGDIVTPGRSVSMRSNDRPPVPAPPVRTAVRRKFARIAPEMSVLAPFTMKCSPRRTAEHWNAPTSEPPEGSVTAKAMCFSPARTGRATRSRISAGPSEITGGSAIQCVARSVKTVPEPRRKNSSAKMMR